MNPGNHRKPFAVITGASRGIGATYARALAQRGFDLLLVSRDASRLHALATTLQNTNGVEVETAVLDLAQPDAGHQLFVLSRQKREHVDLVINNAGFGMYGPFVDMPLPRIHEMLRLHVNTVVDSTRLFLPSMIERKAGAIINVASLAGFFPIPYLSEYAATKAFMISFSEALAEEVRPLGVYIQTCCPGYTDTDFHQTAGVKSPSPLLKPQTSDQVVQTSLRALDRRKVHVTVGWQGRLTDFLSRYFPRTLLIRRAGKRVKPANHP
ncbi:MAG: SDR family NAD(P)-dependent oxidoreductase [Deltaproteobacteria bacterium]|nr:SDR family NAD(P)-dependent oxidoreductase [Deltaproteobacteria bacterium]